MQRILRAAAIGGLSITLGACAMLTGLDQIREVVCPTGCDDASGDAIGSPSWDGAPGSNPESADARSLADVAAGDEPGMPGSQDDGDDDAADASGPTRDAESDASADDGRPDAEEDAAVDAASDATHDAPEDAPRDSGGPCGTVYFHDAFADNSRGWTLDPTWGIAPACASPPAPQKGNADPAHDHTGTAGSGLAGAYVCGNNPSGQTNAARYATSPAVDVSAAPAVKLTFYRWLNTDSSTYMTSTVDVYDGAQWVNVYTNPGGAGNLVTDAAWTKVEYDVTAQKNAAFRVRFGYSVTSTSVYEMSCWNVDDVTLSSASCP